LDETNRFSQELCLVIRIGQISNSYELAIWLKGIVKHYSHNSDQYGWMYGGELDGKDAP